MREQEDVESLLKVRRVFLATRVTPSASATDNKVTDCCLVSE